MAQEVRSRGSSLYAWWPYLLLERKQMMKGQRVMKMTKMIQQVDEQADVDIESRIA